MQRTSLVVCIMVRAGIHLDNTDPEPILVLVSDDNVKDLAWCTLIQDGHFVKLCSQSWSPNSNLYSNCRSTDIH